MLKQRKITYSLLIFLVVIANLYYYRYSYTQYWMRYKIRHEKVVITLSTTPYRIQNMEDTIKTIVAQNISLDGIYLSIPNLFKRDNLPYEIPNWLSKYPEVTVLRTDDYGPATKLLGLLEHIELAPETIIITVDDDTYYPENLALELSYKAHTNPNSAYGLLGAKPLYKEDGLINADSDLGLIKIGTPNAKVSLLQGFAGIAYRRKFFDDRVFEIKNAPEECIRSDDFYLSYFLARNNIDRHVVRNDHICSCKLRWDTNDALNEHALHQMSPGPAYKHQVCLKFLQEMYPNVNF